MLHLYTFTMYNVQCNFKFIGYRKTLDWHLHQPSQLLKCQLIQVYSRNLDEQANFAYSISVSIKQSILFEGLYVGYTANGCFFSQVVLLLWHGHFQVCCDPFHLVFRLVSIQIENNCVPQFFNLLTSFNSKLCNIFNYILFQKQF